MRTYTVGSENKAYPSVTTIIADTATYRQRMNLENWKKKEGSESKAQEARTRGNTFHMYVQSFFSGWSFIVEDYAHLWAAAQPELERWANIGDPVWVECPIPEEWKHAYSLRYDGKEYIQTPSVWSRDYKYAGCPDIIMQSWNDQYILIDIKTSDCPYRTSKPKFDVNRGEQWQEEYKGYMKFERTAIQLAAYARAIRETLGIEISTARAGVLIDGEIPEFKTYTVDDLQHWDKEWIQRVNAWYNRDEKPRKKGKKK